MTLASNAACISTDARVSMVQTRHQETVRGLTNVLMPVSKKRATVNVSLETSSVAFYRLPPARRGFYSRSAR
jgi:hypothetical protein